jgi:D-hexose-6-phosphate mutarotase
MNCNTCFIRFVCVAVLWNPWIEKTKGMADMSPEEYKEFVCVEAGAVAEPVTLEVSC